MVIHLQTAQYEESGGETSVLFLYDEIKHQDLTDKKFADGNFPLYGKSWLQLLPKM